MPNLNDLRARIRDNGIRWTGYHLFAAFLRSRASSLDAAMARLEEEKDLPGINHIHRNRQKWEGWDWSRSGEEWTPSEEWKTSLVECVLKKYVPPAAKVLEIGPGGGRWTEHTTFADSPSCLLAMPTPRLSSVASEWPDCRHARAARSTDSASRIGKTRQLSSRAL
jgi:hypothetical protein